MMTLLLSGTLVIVFDVCPVKAQQNVIYIRADGSIDPPTPKITTSDSVTYTFTEDIDIDSIVVERDDIVIDGAGHTLQGPGDYVGIDLTESTNVRVQNTQIKSFSFGIRLSSSSGNSISGNNITNNVEGIGLSSSDFNTVSDNNITNNVEGTWLFHSFSNSIDHNNITANILNGIYLASSSGNSLSGNNITNNACGIWLYYSDFNTVSGNNITNNACGIWLSYSHGNRFCHNHFIDNSQQVSIASPGDANVWDDGYPSGGNYWSDYSGADLYSGPYQSTWGSDGIGDVPYVVYGGNQDGFPLVKLWTPAATESGSISKGGEAYPIHVTSDATILSFEETPGSIRLSVAGEAGSTGYVRIVQPVGLNSTNIKVFLDGVKLTFPSVDPPRSISTNGTHYFIYFTITFNSAVDLLVTFPLGGDVDYDGDVDIYDIVKMSGVYGTEEGQFEFDPHCDVDDDGDIDIYDIVAAASNYGETW